MCCFATVLLFLGPRAAILVWWLINPARFNAAIPGFLVGCLGFLFLPWTTLAYLLAWLPGGVQGFGWVLVGLGFVADMFSYFGGFRNRNQAQGYYNRYRGG